MLEAAQTLFFKSVEHRSRFVESMQKLGKVCNGKFDPEYASALYILTADQSIWQKARGYVGQDGIEIEDLLQEVDFSGGYGVLIRLAGNLFNAQQHLDPLEFLRLDDSNFRLALTALKLRRYSMHVDDFKDHQKHKEEKSGSY